MTRSSAGAKGEVGQRCLREDGAMMQRLPLGKRVWLRSLGRAGTQLGAAACAANSWRGVNGVTQDVYIGRRRCDGLNVFRSLTGIGP